jgi:hypothetical protein
MQIISLICSLFVLAVMLLAVCVTPPKYMKLNRAIKHDAWEIFYRAAGLWVTLHQTATNARLWLVEALSTPERREARKAKNRAATVECARRCARVAMGKEGAR